MDFCWRAHTRQSRLGLSTALRRESQNFVDSCLVHHFSFHEKNSYPGNLSEKQKRLSSVKLSVMKACNGVPSHIKETYLVPGLLVDITKSDQTVELGGQVVGDGLRRMMEGRTTTRRLRCFRLLPRFLTAGLFLWRGATSIVYRRPTLTRSEWCFLIP